MTEQHTEEKMELAHEPEPGYRKIFIWAISAGILYLAYIFIRCL